MGPDAVILGLGSLLCIAVALCALVFATLRRRQALLACGFGVIALSSVIVADAVVTDVFDSEKPATVTVQAAHSIAVVTSTPAATPARSAAPASTPALPPSRPKPNPASLRKFSVSWANIVRGSASAFKAHDTAGELIKSGNIAAASAELKQCEDAANGIVIDPFGLALDPAHGSDSEFVSAVKKIGDGLRYGCKSARSYLDTSAPGDFEDAHTYFAAVVEGIVQSESLARSKYESLGGNPNSLLSFKNALR